MIRLKQVSSLEKILPEIELNAREITSVTALKGERCAYQVAYKTTKQRRIYDIKMNSDIAEFVTVSKVNTVPVCFPDGPENTDDTNYITHGCAIIPDVLEPDIKRVWSWPYYNCLWVSVAEGAPAGVHEIEIIFEDLEYKESIKCQVEILDVELPKQDLIYTNWFHADCIATHYGVPMLSERHWDLIKKYMEMAVKTGMNMILTPIFTLPLDTEVGGERPTCQLVDIEKKEDTYIFDFTNLKRWMEMAKSVGIKYFEMAHLFSQWGVKASPKIVVTENYNEKKLFGWHESATGELYRNFLDQFLPAIDKFLTENGYKDITYFHVSDEPNMDFYDNYVAAKEMVSEHLKDYHIIEALSNYEFYEKGLVPSPVPATNHIKPFLENKVPNLWTYYCSGQQKDVSNRLLAMPSWRTRCLGMQLFKYDIVGFLHWGFNFYYTAFSKRSLDPFTETDSGGAFPSGDAFCVYPGPDGPWSSVRAEVFLEGLQDLRLLRLLETKMSHEEIVAMLEEVKAIEFDICPESEAEFMAMRNAMINKVKELF